MSRPVDVATEIRTNWAATGLQVEGVSHEGDGARIKVRLPNECDVTDFSAAMFDLGATVMYKNDVVGGPTLLVTAGMSAPEDEHIDTESDTDEETGASPRGKPTPRTATVVSATHKSYLQRACLAVSALRLAIEVTLVAVLAIYFSGIADNMLVHNDTLTNA